MEQNSVRVKVALWRSRHVAYEGSQGCKGRMYSNFDDGNHNMFLHLERVRCNVSRACRTPCVVELPTTPAQWRNFIQQWVFGQPPIRRPLKQTKMHDFSWQPILYHELRVQREATHMFRTENDTDANRLTHDRKYLGPCVPSSRCQNRADFSGHTFYSFYSFYTHCKDRQRKF